MTTAIDPAGCMRILVATDQWFPDRMGGVARVATETARRLSDRGHHVHVIAPAAPGRSRLEIDGRLTIERVLPRGAVPNTVADVVATRSHAVRLRGAYDVALAHVSSTYGGLAAAGLGVPLVAVFHAPAVRELVFRRARLARISKERFGTYALQPLLAALERLAVRGADGILVLSQFSRNLLDADYGALAAPIFDVRAGVNLAAFRPRDGARARLGIEVEPPLLVTVRRLEPRMGLEELVRAMAMVTRPSKLVIIGSGSLATPLAQLVRSLGLDDVVELRGRVDDSELHDWYRAADLFVLPTVAYEGFGLVTAEALASGTPVLGTAVGATPELLGPLDSRLLVHGTTSADLAEAIAAALPFAGELGERCRAYACARFDWDDAIASWERGLQAVLASRGQAASVLAAGRTRSGS